MDATHNSENLRKQLKKGRLIKVAKGEIIHRSGEGFKFFLIVSGYVKRYLVTNEGNLSIQGIFGPTYMLPLTSVYDLLLQQEIYQGPETYYYEAMCTSKIHVVDEEEFLEIIKKDNTLYRDLFAVAGRRLRSNIQELENVSLRNAHARVAHQILCYAKEFGVKKSSSVQIVVPLTHETLAGVLNLARETVSQSISQLREEGLIKTNKGITVLDMGKLEEIAYA